jgi:metal-responsive CopG/Arc/MetJ family transcriptional regulator
MTVEIEIDENLLAKVDDITKNLRINRDKYFQKLVEEDLIARQYAEAYEKNPVQPDEFEIEEEQLIEVWKDL